MAAPLAIALFTPEMCQAHQADAGVTYYVSYDAQVHSVGDIGYLHEAFSGHLPGFGIVKVERVETSEIDEGQTFRIAFNVVDADSEEVRSYHCLSFDVYSGGLHAIQSFVARQEEDMVDDGASSGWQQMTGDSSLFTSAAETPSRGAGEAGTLTNAEQIGGTQSHEEMLLGSQQLDSHFSDNDVSRGGPVATHNLLVCSGLPAVYPVFCGPAALLPVCPAF